MTGAASPSPSDIPAQLGPFKILAQLGEGSFGVVYKAEHVRIGKLMAIKLLHGELARDKDVVKRFKRDISTVFQ